MFFIALRPSRTASFMDEKFEFINIRCEISLAAELPDAIDTEQSASFKAKMSFIPSPIIATLLPLDFKAVMISLFFSGVTLANIEYLLTDLTTSEYLFKVLTSMDLS